jgi:hypothetical protein
MTEVEWLACNDLEPMLAFLRDKARDRKIRLFACACYRRATELEEELSHGLSVARVPEQILLAEGYADGKVAYGELAFMFRRRYASNPHPEVLLWHAGYDGLIYPDPLPMEFVGRLADWPVRTATDRCTTSIEVTAARSEEQHRQSNMFRDIFGNPFRPVVLDPAWLAWNGGTVRKMAQAIYDDRAFDRLPILADALEEAGCANRDILDHCRSGGDHVRGCWVIDLLLGKE